MGCETCGWPSPRRVFSVLCARSACETAFIDQQCHSVPNRYDSRMVGAKDSANADGGLSCDEDM